MEYVDFIGALRLFGLTDNDIDKLDLSMFREQYMAEHSYVILNFSFEYCGEYLINLWGITRGNEQGKCKICNKMTNCKHTKTGDYYCSKICLNVATK